MVPVLAKQFAGVTYRAVYCVYKLAKVKANVDKDGGIHGLRHAYATHQLEVGMPIVDLQRQMGHSSIMTTLRYLHWVPDYKSQKQCGGDLLAQLSKGE